MSEWISKLRDRFRWRFVGLVEGVTVWVDFGNIRESTYWHLYERGDGKRRYSRTGNKDLSSAARFMEAQVIAWRFGGPLPRLVHGAEAPKPKAKLISFNGGKSA